MGVVASSPDPGLAKRFAERARDLFGSEFLDPAGVLHVAAVWRDPDGSLAVMAIEPATPRSDTDAFVLELSRARADAIVTTGKILRDEAQLRFQLSDEATSWRALTLGKTEPPAVLVLTSGRDPMPRHGSFAEPGIRLLFTSGEGADLLRSQSFESATQIVSVGRPGLETAIDFLRRQLDAGIISIEAGPSTSATLYSPRLIADELLLSIFEAPELSPELRAGALPPLQELELMLPITSSVRELTEASGSWSFRRLRRSIL